RVFCTTPRNGKRPAGTRDRVASRWPASLRRRRPRRRRAVDADACIALFAGALELVHVESAAARIAEAEAPFLSKAPHSPRLEVGEQELMRACLHEGGHAAVAVASGLVVSRALVRGAGGCVKY